MPRFFWQNVFEVGQCYAVPPAILAHMRALRLDTGAAVTLFNGEGGEYAAELIATAKKTAVVRVLDYDAISRESPLKLTLVQAVSVGERMDYTVQKSVELGVSVIQPVLSDYSTVRLNDERRQKRLIRWQEIAVAACEQCGRNHLPEIRPVITLAEYWQQMPPQGSQRLVFAFGGQRMVDVLRPDGCLAVELLIGAEGGLSAAEVDAARSAGFVEVTLGARVLRTETAAVAALATLQVLAGDF